jgi:hypothetical protein
MVVGGADCVWGDIVALAERGYTDLPVFAVNDMGVDLARLDHWVTLHPEKLGAWQDARAAWGGSDAYVVWEYNGDDWGGSSGLFAVRIAMDLGFKRVILCGVPMDDRPHVSGKAWPNVGEFRPAWEERRELLAPVVRSMSGWTREQFGLPEDVR